MDNIQLAHQKLMMKVDKNKNDKELKYINQPEPKAVKF